MIKSAISFAALAMSFAGAVMASEAALERGASIYAEACASCHGADLSGEPDWQQRGADGRLPAPPHDETGHTWHHPDPILMAIIVHGTAAVVGGGYESNMPGFGEKYSDEELWDVLSWIKSQWPEDIRARQAEITQQAAP
ncbi:c-type cytochrome [Palleronia caenipelagi]|uniref:Cytochrome c n=1 Tax=Palleronia caenipelagi TaxID=2489174 RepID=A0A547Q9Z6_9RHOB|nr:c-type cytochrome [Palleronia caenipelagi]TRD23190.1 cytochrome c [Palleronia caenipelagi]